LYFIVFHYYYITQQYNLVMLTRCSWEGKRRPDGR